MCLCAHTGIDGNRIVTAPSLEACGKQCKLDVGTDTVLVRDILHDLFGANAGIHERSGTAIYIIYHIAYSKCTLHTDIHVA